MEFEKALLYLNEAEAYYNLCLNFDDVVTESADMDIIVMEAEKKATNGVITSVLNLIQSLIDAVKNGISEFISFFKKDYMTAKQKEEYKEMKKFIKEHPEFGELPTVDVSFNEFKKVYDSALSKLDRELQKEDPDENIGELVYAALEEKVNRMRKDTKIALAKVARGSIKTGDKMFDKAMGTAIKLANTESKAVKHSTLNAMLDAADNNLLTAKVIKNAMDEELIDLEQMKQDYGKRYAKKFERNINRYVKQDIFRRGRLALRRIKLKILNHEQKTFREIINEHKNIYTSHFNGYKAQFNAKKRSAMKEYETNKKFFS